MMKRVDEGKVFYREYDGKKYSCELNFLNEHQKLSIEAELPLAFADAPSCLFEQFENLLMGFNSISSLELIHEQLKLISWKDSTLAECRDIQVCCWLINNGAEVAVSLKISEFEGKIISYARPIQFGILQVDDDGSWHWYDKEMSAHAYSATGEGDKEEIIAETEKAKALIKSRFPMFEHEAKKIFKEVFSA